jgi:hypothetical protein
MSLIKKIFFRKKYSDSEIKIALESVSEAVYRNCVTDARQILKNLKSYDKSKGYFSELNLEELMSYIIFSNSLGLDTYEVRIQDKYYLFIALKTMWLLKQNSGLESDLYKNIPPERFNDGKFLFVQRLDEYFSIMKNSKPIEMCTANVTRAALKYIYSNDEFIELERAIILSNICLNLRERYISVPFIERLL